VSQRGLELAGAAPAAGIAPAARGLADKRAIKRTLKR